MSHTVRDRQRGVVDGTASSAVRRGGWPEARRRGVLDGTKLGGVAWWSDGTAVFSPLS